MALMFWLATRLVSVGITTMIEVNRKISHAVEPSLRALEMGLGAAPEALHGDFILADRSSASIEVANLDLERPAVRARITQIAFDRHLVAAADQTSSRDLDRLHGEQGEEHVEHEAKRR